jgi:preprotein translocase subunit Sec63
MVPTTVPSGILLFAKFALVLATFGSFFVFRVQNRSRTVFTRGKMFVKIAFFRRNIVTVFTHEQILATFGYFWVRKLIVRVGVR